MGTLLFLSLMEPKFLFPRSLRSLMVRRSIGFRCDDAMNTSRIPSECPVCGAYSLAPEASTSALLAVCDVLTIKSLETIGKWIVRAERSRFRVLGTRPWYVAHTLWQPEDAIVSKALRGAWDVVPAMVDEHGCCDVTSRQIVAMLDSYVHDLVVTGTAHTIGELQYRMETRLGLPVFTREVHCHDAFGKSALSTI